MTSIGIRAQQQEENPPKEENPSKEPKGNPGNPWPVDPDGIGGGRGGYEPGYELGHGGAEEERTERQEGEPEEREPAKA